MSTLDPGKDSSTDTGVSNPSGVPVQPESQRSAIADADTARRVVRNELISKDRFRRNGCREF
jgi:hypothetical protein